MADLAPLAVAAPQQVRGVGLAALALGDDLGYVNCSSSAWHGLRIADLAPEHWRDFGYTYPPKMTRSRCWSEIGLVGGENFSLDPSLPRLPVTLMPGRT